MPVITPCRLRLGSSRRCHTPAYRRFEHPPHGERIARTQEDPRGTSRRRSRWHVGQIEKQYGKGAIMRLGEHGNVGVEAIPTGALALDLALGIGGLPARPGRRDLRPRVVREVDPRHARRRRGPAQRRRLRLHRRRARDGPGLRGGHRRQRRRSPHLPARHGRAGARDRRHADPLGRARRRRHRLGRRARAPGRDRGRDGRHPRRPPGPAHEPGAAQAHRQPQPVATRSACSSTSCGRRSA